MDVSRKLSMVFVGVGGQGLMTAARVLAEAAVDSSTKALVAETHGLSQRGGSIEVHVRLGNVYSPLVPVGEAHVVLGFEMIEAARGVKYLARSGMLLTSETIMRPPLPGVRVPKRAEIESVFKSAGIRYYVVPARAIAEKVGSYMTENMVLLGALAGTGLLEGLVDMYRLRARISELPYADKNLAAFEEGLNTCRSTCGNL